MDPEGSSVFLRFRIGYCGPARRGSVISYPWDLILRYERRPFLKMKRTHPAVARGPSVVMDGGLVSSCSYIAKNSIRVQSYG